MTRSCVQDPRETMGVKPHRALSWRGEQPCSRPMRTQLDVKRMVRYAQRTLVALPDY
jgi:hypothetical protein